ncbi:hypothetical protein [Novosphingobium sp. M1R2S20]|uniref:4-hydroxy-tetrahydrodipicolinate reductase n=1 Tax=Novosphingobium rhizovicinum TaxID=3228928 RepID=A0ABV3REU3_9SPHN
MTVQRKYRVIQWATGNVGKVAIRQFVENPAFELAGVLVTNPDKVGKDAGELAGLPPTGVIATDDVETIMGLAADCVHFAGAVEDLDTLCRLLRSGKNVVSPLGPFYPSNQYPHSVETSEAIAAACREGGTSFHGSGIHPGFAGDLLPLILARAAGRIDHIHVTEVVDFSANPSSYIPFMGFGREPADLLANPARSPDAALMFSQSMAMVIEALGKTIERMETSLELATATRDIPYPGGVVTKGTVGGQHYEWTAIVEGKPLMTFHCFWTMGDAIDPAWNCGPSGYSVRLEGDPALMMTLSGIDDQGRPQYPGLSLTALLGVNAIPAVCDAPPGIVTHREMGLFVPPGLLR